eukprot:SAG11_NODE_220_length_12154_cov_92.233347_7_plen_137_part_00
MASNDRPAAPLLTEAPCIHVPTGRGVAAWERTSKALSERITQPSSSGSNEIAEGTMFIPRYLVARRRHTSPHRMSSCGKSAAAAVGDRSRSYSPFRPHCAMGRPFMITVRRMPGWAICCAAIAINATVQVQPGVPH